MQLSNPHRVLIPFIFSLLISCGGGSSDTSPVTEGADDTPLGQLTGYILPSPQSAGRVRLIDSSGSTVSDVTTSADGYFEVQGQFKAGEYRLNVEHQGLNEFSGARSSSGNYNISFQFSAGGIQSVFGTTFSRLTSIGSNSLIEEWVGFNPLRTQPAILNAGNYSGENLNTQIKHGALTQAISVLSKNLGREDTEAFTDMMIQDFSPDSLLDGKGSNGVQLAYNGVLVTPSMYRVDLSIALLEVLNSSLNLTNVKGQAATDYANSFANSSASVVPAVDYVVDVLNPIEEDEGDTGTPEPTGPYSFQYAGPVQFGEVKVELIADDINTVSTFYINSSDYSYFEEATFSNGSYYVLVDTTQFADGAMGFELSVSLVDGNSYNTEISFDISNSGSKVTLVSDAFTNNYSYNAVVATEYDESDISNVLINNKNALRSNGEYSASINLLSGANTVTVIVNLKNGLSTTSEFVVSVDDTEPNITEVFHEFTSGYKVGYYKPADDIVVSQYLAFDSSFPFFLTEGSSTLNFIDPTIANLKEKKHAFLEAKVSDNYSDFNDITVEYDSLVNGTGIKYNQSVTVNENGHFAIPVTTEVFSNLLRTNELGDTFSLIVKATDGSGNITTKTYSFNVKYAAYQIEPSPSMPNGHVVSGSVLYVPGGYYADAQEVSINVGGTIIKALSPTNPSFNFSTSTLPEGEQTLTITVKTIYGDVYTQDITLIVDNLKPVITTDLVVESSSSSYTLVGTATDARGINSVSVNGVSVSFDSVTGEFSKTINLSSGVQYIPVVVEDNTFNRKTVSVEITYDPTKPQIQVVSPYNTLQNVWIENDTGNSLTNFYLTSNNPLVIFNGNKNYDGLVLNENNLSNHRIPHGIFEIKEIDLNGDDQAVNVTLSVSKNGVPFITNQVLAPRTGFTYLLPFTEELLGLDWFKGLDSDIYSFTVKATGQSKQSEYSFELATKEAVNQVESPLTSADAFKDPNENFYFEIGDQAGLTKSELIVNGQSYVSADPTVATFLVDLSGLADGVYPMSLVLSDRAGERLNESMSFTIDRTAPTFTHNLPEYSKEYAFLVEGVVSDTGVGIDRLYIDGQPVTFNSSTGAYSFEVEINPNAGNIENDDSYESQHVFTVTDKLGNQVTETVMVKVDRVGAFIFPQSVTVSGQGDIQCDGNPDVAKSWYGEQTNGDWIIYRNTKTLGATSILDDAALNDRSIAFFKFYTWSYSRDHHMDLEDLTDVTFSYFVDDVPVFLDKPVQSLGVFGYNNVNEFRIALTEEYLGEGFYQTGTNQTHKIEVQANDPIGHNKSYDFRFRVCNYVDLGIDR